MDALCRPSDEPAPRARATDALSVAARPADAPPASTLASYKDAAAGAEAPPSALSEQHVWKLISALFLEQAAASSLDAADEGEAVTLQAARRREAVRAWLRLALWDSAAAECSATTTAGGDGAGDGGAQLARLLALSSAAHPDEAARAALADTTAPRAYLAALLAQPASAIAADVEAFHHSVPPDLLPPALPKLHSRLEGESGAPAGWSEGAWMRAYARSVQADGSGVGGAGALPSPAAVAGAEGDADNKPPVETMWHLLRLYTGSDVAALTPPSVPAPAGPREGSWVRLGDYGLAWHLCRTLSALTHLRPPSAKRVHESFLGQLEAGGACSLLVDACRHANDEASLLKLLERMPLPDTLTPAAAELLALSDAPAALTPHAVRLAPARRRLAELHAAAGVRHASEHQHSLAFKHHLAVVQLHVAATSAATAAATAAGAGDDNAMALATTGATATGDAMESDSVETDAEAALASRSWHLAHALLIDQLRPSPRVLSDELSYENASMRLLGVTAPALDRRGEWSAGGAAIGRSATAAAAPPAEQARWEEITEGGAMATATVARIAAAMGA